jgi:hypothetical protein
VTEKIAGMYNYYGLQMNHHMSFDEFGEVFLSIMTQVWMCDHTRWIYVAYYSRGLSQPVPPSRVAQLWNLL